MAVQVKAAAGIVVVIQAADGFIGVEAQGGVMKIAPDSSLSAIK
jgi:hypothetical protein